MLQSTDARPRTATLRAAPPPPAQILCVRSYEIAAAKMTTKANQARAVARMNATFQFACFTAVVISVAVSDLGFFEAP